MKFEDEKWTRVGELQQARGYHSVIALGLLKMIIGGFNSDGEDMYVLIEIHYRGERQTSVT